MNNVDLITKPRQKTAHVHVCKTHANMKLADIGHVDAATALQQMNTRLEGLTGEEVETRLEEFGYNDVAKEKRLSYWKRLFIIVRNPLIVLLIALEIVSYVTSDVDAAIIIVILAGASVILRFFQ